MQFNNKVYNAYFTTAIPYSAGPINFRGLPGLILQVNIEGKDLGYYATEIINPYEGVVPKFHEEGKHISREEYNKILEKQND